MSIFKRILHSRIILIIFLWFFVLPATASPSLQYHEKISFNCIQDELEKYFCTNVSVANPDIILTLPRLERKKISRYVNAFRIMPSVTNLTNETITFAKIRLKFWEKSDPSHDFVIQQKIIPNDSSHTKISYLIRSDVPVQTLLYGELLATIENGSYDHLILELLDVKYVE